ncbi:MAG: hypothetical protein AAGE86_03910 [Pseudomonadota bacterium]
MFGRVDIEDRPIGTLTDFEITVLNLHEAGFSRDEIVEELGCSRVSVKNVLGRYLVRVDEEKADADDLRARTVRFGVAVAAAGGHR